MRTILETWYSATDGSNLMIVELADVDKVCQFYDPIKN